MLKTNFIVLRKTPYQESGLVVAGLSPDYGRVDLIVKGARAIGRKKFPIYELFRELAIQFREPGSGSSLALPRSAEALENFDGVTANPDAYLTACDFAAFLLRHSRHMLECHASYCAFKTMLSRLAKAELEPKRAAALAKLSFLQEAGLLPDGIDDGQGGDSAKQSLLLQELLQSGAGEIPPPAMSPAYWLKLSNWVDALAAYHGLN